MATPPPPETLHALDRQRARILLGCAIGLGILLTAFLVLGPPGEAFAVVAVLVVPPFIGAVITFRALGRKRADLLARDSTRSPQAPAPLSERHG